MLRPQFPVRLRLPAVLGIVLAGLIFLPACQRQSGRTSAAPPSVTTFSAAAPGLALLFHLLTELDPETVRLSQDEVRPGEGLLIISDPVSLLPRLPGFPQDGQTLLILPAWIFGRQSLRPSWISWARPRFPLRTEEVLTAHLGLDFTGCLVTFQNPVRFEVNPFQIDPEFSDGRIQLLTCPGITPVIAAPEGILLGRLTYGPEKTVWILADPDLLNNHGLPQGRNLALTLAVLASLSQGKKTVFAEYLPPEFPILSGREIRYQDVKDFFSLQSAAMILLLVFAAGMLLFAGQPFGPLLKPEPVHSFGRQKLLENSARLLEFTGRPGEIARRYLEMTFLKMALLLHAPRGQSAPERYRWLEKACPGFRPEELLAQAGQAKSFDSQLLALARKVQAWKVKAASGSTTDKQHNPSHPQ